MGTYNGCASCTSAGSVLLVNAAMLRFPIREFGVNYESQPLQEHEIEAMKADPVIVERIINSYRLMLNFYGMQLVSPKTGLVARLPKYRTRYRNLVRKFLLFLLRQGANGV